MPAVDSPDPGGMTPTELTAVLRAAMKSRKCVGMELTIYDPELDPTGKYAKLIVDLVVEAVGM